MKLSKVHYIQKPELLINQIEHAIASIKHQTEKFFLFGSLATKNFLINSDVDLFVVSDELELNAIRSVLDPILTDIGIYYDLILMNNQEFEENKNLVVVQEALGGVVLWAKKRTELLEQESI